MQPDRAHRQDDPAPTAEILVARAREGDVAAFEELYRAHHRRIYALALRMTGDAARAEEVTQEAFVRAWESLPGFRGESSFGTWLHGLAVHVALRHERTERRRKARVEATDDLSGYTAEVRRAMPETSIALERAVAALPDGARRVLVLHDIQGYRYEEVARLLGIAVGTVKAQLHRARKLVMEAVGR
jgi:RNA polymerase sigma-70 factor (ECF subfamily)